jgi:hypothetical protein
VRKIAIDGMSVSHGCVVAGLYGFGLRIEPPRRVPGERERAYRPQPDAYGVREEVVRPVADDLLVERRTRPDGKDEDEQEDAAADRDAVELEAPPGERPRPCGRGTSNCPSETTAREKPINLDD